jgi:hypothetical protein
MRGSVRYASGDCLLGYCSTWESIAGVGDRAALTGLHPSTMAYGFKGLRSARTWGGQSPGVQKVTRHSTHLDTAVIEPQVSVRRAFARVVRRLKNSLMGLLRTSHAVDDVEVAYKPTAWSAEPESDQPRASSNHDNTFRSRCTASAIPVCCDGRTPRRRTIVPARRPGKARPCSLHDSVAGRTAGGMRHVTASVPVGGQMGRLRLPAGCPAVAIPRPTVRRRTARGVRRSAATSPRCPRGARLRGRNQASGRPPWMPWPEHPDDGCVLPTDCARMWF